MACHLGTCFLENDEWSHCLMTPRLAIIIVFLHMIFVWTKDAYPRVLEQFWGKVDRRKFSLFVRHLPHREKLSVEYYKDFMKLVGKNRAIAPRTSYRQVRVDIGTKNYIQLLDHKLNETLTYCIPYHPFKLR